MEGTDEKEEYPPLSTLGDVQRAMAAHCRRIRNGEVSDKAANALTVAYNVLHGMMRDARDSRYQKRLKVLWEAHERGTGAQPEADGPEVQ